VWLETRDYVPSKTGAAFVSCVCTNDLGWGLELMYKEHPTIGNPQLWKPVMIFLAGA